MKNFREIEYVNLNANIVIDMSIDLIIYLLN
jgi:hypothetical protein